MTGMLSWDMSRTSSCVCKNFHPARLLHHTLVEHSLGNYAEAGNVCAVHVVDKSIGLKSGND